MSNTRKRFEMFGREWRVSESSGQKLFYYDSKIYTKTDPRSVGSESELQFYDSKKKKGPETPSVPANTSNPPAPTTYTIPTSSTSSTRAAPYHGPQQSAPTTSAIEPIDTTGEYVDTYCQEVSAARLKQLEWLLRFVDEDRDPIDVALPPSLISGSSCLKGNKYFRYSADGQPNAIINAVIALEQSLPNQTAVIRSEETVLHCCSNITGQFWAHLNGAKDRPKVFRYALNKAERVSASSARFTTGQDRPDETAYMNGCLTFKAEHKAESFDDAIADIKNKLLDYNPMVHGEMLYLPVCVAAGNYVQFGFVSLNNKEFYGVDSPVDITNAKQRARVVHQSIQMFRILIALAAVVPLTQMMSFTTSGRIKVFVDHVLKNVDTDDLAPDALYEYLKEDHPFCAKYTYRSRHTYRISPIGSPLSATKMCYLELRVLVRCVLRCLVELHDAYFVHRDIRWSNVVRTFLPGTKYSYMLIDFEFASVRGEILQLNGGKEHWYERHMDPTNTEKRFEFRDDLRCLALLIAEWAQANSPVAEQSSAINDFIGYLQTHDASATSALNEMWMYDAPESLP